MDKMTMVQARTPNSLKNEATEILEKLGLNLSTYINMSLRQLVIRKAIPFEVQLEAPKYTIDEAVKEVEATLKMEGFHLTKDELELLKAYRKGEISGDQIRKKILSEE